MQFRDISDYLGVTFSIKFLWYYHFWCQCWVFSTMELGHLFFLNLLFNSPNRLALCVRGKISLTCPCLDADNGSQCAITPQMLPAICWMCLQLWHTDCSCRCALRQISWLPTAHPCDLAWIHPAPSACSEEDAHLSNWKETWKTLSSPTKLIKSCPAALTSTALRNDRALFQIKWTCIE